MGFDPWVGKIPWRRAWQPAPVFLPGESQGQRSLEGCSPWGCKEANTSEQQILSDSKPLLTFQMRCKKKKFLSKRIHGKFHDPFGVECQNAESVISTGALTWCQHVSPLLLWLKNEQSYRNACSASMNLHIPGEPLCSVRLEELQKLQ